MTGFEPMTVRIACTQTTLSQAFRPLEHCFHIFQNNEKIKKWHALNLNKDKSITLQLLQIPIQNLDMLLKLVK